MEAPGLWVVVWTSHRSIRTATERRIFKRPDGIGARMTAQTR